MYRPTQRPLLHRFCGAAPAKVSYRVLSGTVVGVIQDCGFARRGVELINPLSKVEGVWGAFGDAGARASIEAEPATLIGPHASELASAHEFDRAEFRWRASLDNRFGDVRREEAQSEDAGEI